MSTPPGERRKPGSCNRGAARALAKAYFRSKRRGNKPPPATRWSSREIMRWAGRLGMQPVRRSRKLAGYRHATPSKYP